MPKIEVDPESKKSVLPRTPSPPILPIFIRTLVLVVTLVIATGVAATWYAEGLSWVYDKNLKYSPFVDCPSSYLTKQGASVDGPMCQLLIRYNQTIAHSIRNQGIESKRRRARNMCVIPEDPQDEIACQNPHPCAYSCIQMYKTRTAGNSITWRRGPAGSCPLSGMLKEVGTIADQPMCSLWMHRGDRRLWRPSSGVATDLSFGTSMNPIPCKHITTRPYCDGDFHITPSNEIAIRGLFIACLFMVIIWHTAEWILWKVDWDLRKEKTLGLSRMAELLPEKRRVLETDIKHRWMLEYQDAQRTSGSVYTSNTWEDRQSSWTDGPGGLGGAGTFNPPSSVVSQTRKTSQLQRAGSILSDNRSMLESRNPEKRFESKAWKRRLGQYQLLSGRKSDSFKAKQLIRTFLLNVFFIGLLIGSLYLVIAFSPQNLTQRRTFGDTLRGNVSIWETSSALDILIFADVLLDFSLFFVAAALVKWPTAPVFSRHLQNKISSAEAERENTASSALPLKDGDVQMKLAEGAKEGPSAKKEPKIPGCPASEANESDDGSSYASDTDSGDSDSLNFVMKQTLAHDCCLMIACHCSTMTEERYSTFVNTLKSALKVFPPSHVFVCDNGGTSKPQDETQFACREVHPDINYLYVPEGNKTFAFYWCNRYWIPFLERHGRVPPFKYAVIIDDDVPLPSDLHIPHEHLSKDPNIKAVHFPLTATTPDGEQNLLVSCQDIEYKFAAVHKLLQATLARCLSCHGAIALWERRAMDDVFYHHDTVFHGEDLYMGLTLLRKRDNSRIISCGQTVVPTFAPDTFGMLFRQRVKSWELTSHKKTFSYVAEIFHPASLFHFASWVIKPYFIQELLTILLDWLRLFLICGLFLRDWVGLLLMVGIFNILLYIQVIVFQVVVLRQRPELRSSLCTVLVFPWYRLSNLLFRLCALCQNLLVYSHERSLVKIGVREDEIRDIPPCPPHVDVSWFNVWKKVAKGEDDNRPELEGVKRG